MPLKPEEKDHVVETLKELLYEAKKEQIRNSLEAYETLQKALEKDSAMMNLYYEAIKQVNYIDKGRRSSDFLSWKSKKRSEYSRLRYRGWINLKFRWLMLSIDAFNFGDPSSYLKHLSELQPHHEYSPPSAFVHSLSCNHGSPNRGTLSP